MSEHSNQSVKVKLDASIFAEDRSFGRLSGSIKLATVPQIGDEILLLFLPAVNLRLTVEHRVFMIGHASREILIFLSDIQIDNLKAAESLVRDLEKNFDLFVDIF